MLLPVKGEAGAADASQWTRCHSHSEGNPAPVPSFPRGRPLCPPCPLCPCSGIWLVPGESCLHSSPSSLVMDHTTNTATPKKPAPARTTHSGTYRHTRLALHLSFGPTSPWLGSPQRKLTVSLHQCAALFHGHVVKAACSLTQPPIHAPFRGNHPSRSPFPLPHTHP